MILIFKIDYMNGIHGESYDHETLHARRYIKYKIHALDAGLRFCLFLLNVLKTRHTRTVQIYK